MMVTTKNFKTYRSHYDYLEKHLPAFYEKLGIPYEPGVIVAHGDKCYSCCDYWQDNGLHFYHGVAIYLLTYERPFSKEVRETAAGWVEPDVWVLENAHRFLPFLEPIS